jgi:hypothetical protein
MNWLKDAMNWLNENKDWIFSGVGVFFVTVLYSYIKEIRKASWKAYHKGYHFPNTLSYWCYHKPEGELIKQDSRRIICMRATRNKRIEINYPIFATGEIVESHSLSDPERMRLVKAGEKEGIESIEILAEKNRDYLIVSESKRTSNINKINKPSANDRVRSTLYSKCLVVERPGFAGISIVARTKSVRIIVEFSNDFKPKNVNPVQIADSGKIIRDEHSSDFVKVGQNDRTLFILDLADPELGSIVYLWWNWPELPSLEKKREKKKGTGKK